MIDLQQLQYLALYLAPYLVCLVSLLVGVLAGTLATFLFRRRGTHRPFQERLTIFVSVTLWLLVTVLFWVLNHQNPITNRINSGGGLT